MKFTVIVMRWFTCSGCSKTFSSGSGPYCPGCLSNSPGKM